jgi:hypothetical protein
MSLCFLSNRESFIERNKIYNDVNETVLGFIYDFSMCCVKNESDYYAIQNTFINEYSYYFAHMLKTAFGRGTVCCAICLGGPPKHFVWMDINNIPYCIGGVYDGADEYIPESYIKEAIDGFKHIPGRVFNENVNKDYFDEAIDKYRKDNNIII